MALVGATFSIRGASMMSMHQSNIDREYMGRSMSVLVMVGSLSLQLGMLVWGPLSDIVSLDWLLVGCGAGLLLMGIIVFFDKTLRKAGLASKTSDASH